MDTGLFDFLKYHGNQILTGITALAWYLYSFSSKPGSLIKLLFFPAAHFRAILQIRQFPAAFVIGHCYLVFIFGIVQLCWPASPHVYLVGWGLFVLFDIFTVTLYLFNIRKTGHYLFVGIISLAYIIYVIVNSIHLRSYAPLITLGFAIDVYVFIVAVIILSSVVIKGIFHKEIDAFFIFFGWLVNSFLDILSSSILSIDFIEHFDFSYYATLITMLYWCAIILWIRRLKYKLSSP
jgi:hypothetical protein